MSFQLVSRKKGKNGTFVSLQRNPNPRHNDHQKQLRYENLIKRASIPGEYYGKYNQWPRNLVSVNEEFLSYLLNEKLIKVKNLKLRKDLWKLKEHEAQNSWWASKRTYWRQREMGTLYLRIDYDDIINNSLFTGYAHINGNGNYLRIDIGNIEPREMFKTMRQAKRALRTYLCRNHKILKTQEYLSMIFSPSNLDIYHHIGGDVGDILRFVRRAIYTQNRSNYYMIRGDTGNPDSYLPKIHLALSKVIFLRRNIMIRQIQEKQRKEKNNNIRNNNREKFNSKVYLLNRNKN